MKTGQFHLRAWTTPPPPPSFSPQRESRALMMRQDGYPNQGAPGGQADLPPGTFLLTRNKLDGERALDSRCDEKDGGEDENIPDSRCERQDVVKTIAWPLGVIAPSL